MDKIKKTIPFKELNQGFKITFPIFQTIKDMGIFDSEQTIRPGESPSKISSYDKFYRIANVKKLLYSDSSSSDLISSNTNSRLGELSSYNNTQEYYPGYIKGSGTTIVNDDSLDINYIYNWFDVYIKKELDSNGNEIHIYGFSLESSTSTTMKKNQRGIMFRDTYRNGSFIETNATFNSIGNDHISETIDPLIKEDYLMGVSEVKETVSNVFIDRGRVNALEKIMRLNEINSVDKLARYQRGYYNIL